MKAIEICITSACNLKCLHCYQNNDKNTSFLSFEKYSELIEYLSEEDIENIVFSGGEFFMYPFAYEAINLAIEKTSAKITIQNNGTVINAEEFVNLYKTQNDRVKLSFSLDGFEQEHDIRRGKGAFKKLITTNNYLRNNGFITNTIVTIDGNNIYYLPELIEFATENFSTVTLLCIANVGAASENSDLLGLEDNNIKRVIRMLYQQLSLNNRNNIRCNVFPYSLSLRYDSTLFPCSLARDMNLFMMGNINKDSIRTIVNNFPLTPEGKELLQYKSKNDIIECSICPKLKDCHQGCRIRAMKAYKALMKPDPFACFVYGKDAFCNANVSNLFWGAI